MVTKSVEGLQICLTDTRYDTIFHTLCIKGLTWAYQRTFECFIELNPTECFTDIPLSSMEHSTAQFHRAAQNHVY